MRFVIRLSALAVLFSALAAVTTWAQTTTEQPAKPDTNQSDKDASESEKYIRIERDKDGRKLALQTAIVRFEGQAETEHAGVVVDLVGVVHIGEKDYYRELNDLLGTYDSVLYELVAPDGTRIRPEDLKQRRSIVASMQTGMKDMLKLEYQLEQIDYMAENFRHADMSPEEFTEDLERRGDSVVKMMARMMGAGLATQAKTGGDLGVLMALFSQDRSTAMKNAMAKQLIDMEAVTAGMDDANGENTLIKGRNAKAFEVLKEELAKGNKKLAVFYGAGHLSDMAERLENDFQMRPTSTTWFNAWDLKGDQ
ncbi:TraB/GumN family protein [Rhodopirellula sp. MGV]|uniref:TraB/GumN family protein n=1 Tax=Rhodopirellula sp. MGV TaxID=2023130 RepID=UPI001E463431|nr:TraB/GumN family protein [Rhodopirellula sp. MGV]